MPSSRFVAPKSLETLEQAREALQRIQEQLDALTGATRPQLIVADVTLRAGEFIRISPRQGRRLFAKLPKATADNFGEEICIALERPNGSLVVSAEAPDTVNGQRTNTFSAATRIELQSNGVDQWVSTNALPSTSPSAPGNGPSGPPGLAGQDGQDGPPGPAGVPGTAGSAGLQGPPGERGEDGAAGPPGADGAAGAAGAPGAAGSAGLAGPPGLDGQDGQDGSPGGPGANGAAGAPGAAGVAGANGPPGLDGQDGAEGVLMIQPNGVAVQSAGALVVSQATVLNATTSLAATAASSNQANISYVGTTSEVQLTGITGNQATIDISALECGGTVEISAPTGDWQIEGFTAKTQGFWFFIVAGSTNFLGTLFNEDATAVATDRIRCPENRDYVGGRQMTGIVKAHSSRWFFVPGGTPNDFIQFGTDVGMPAVGDIRKGTAASLELNTAAGLRLIATAGGVVLTAGGANLAASSTAAINLASTTGCNLSTTGVSDNSIRGARLIAEGVGGAGGTQINVQEMAASPTVPAGYVGYGARDLAPSQARITDDVDVDWDVNMFGVAVATAIPSVTASTGALSACSYSVQPNTLRVGTTYIVDAIGNYTRGATATAHNITFSLTFNGTVYQTSGAIAANVAAGTYWFHVKAFFTCLSIGAAGTFIGQMQVINNLVAAPTVASSLNTSVSTVAAGTTQNTTSGTLALSLQAAMSAIVAATTVRFTNAVIYKASN